MRQLVEHDERVLRPLMVILVVLVFEVAHLHARTAWENPLQL